MESQECLTKVHALSLQQVQAQEERNPISLIPLYRQTLLQDAS